MYGFVLVILPLVDTYRFYPFCRGNLESVLVFVRQRSSKQCSFYHPRHHLDDLDITRSAEEGPASTPATTSPSAAPTRSATPSTTFPLVDVQR